MMSRLASVVCVAVVAVCTTSLSARQASAPLPIGKTESGQATDKAPANYQFKAASAGVLTVLVSGDGDVELAITDEDGQAVQDGVADDDLFGSTGTEKATVLLTEPGVYRVQVRTVDGGSSKFQIGAAWISMPSLAKPSDPDRRPGQARALEVGKSHEDSIDTTKGDPWDWFVFTPAQAGTLAIVLRPVGKESFDLTLETYADGDFTKPTASSDQDLQGHAANESISIDVPAGQKVYVKVYAGFGSATGKYRLSSSLIK